ncbi:peptidylprolyl isomerase [Achromobacter sp. LC458]|uniref:peptidylprolyl isomerase n=1 Tax=Achromobacter sp. LC458 TaxID=1120623 RepID=UPI000629F618|nr:peptidylprolyl isomerase [Achromobacter sp. LC458]TRM52389.1 peptidylprolyl isomerase [Achromobacter sp. LC458]
MNQTLTANKPLRVTAAVLLIAVLAGAVALMRGKDAQSSEASPTAAAAASASAPAPAPGSAKARTLAATAATATPSANATAKPQANSPQPQPATAIATLGAVRVDRDELLRQLQALPPQARQQLQDNRAGLEQWLRARLAEKALIEQARAQGWQDQPEIRRAVQAAEERIVMQSYLESVSRAPDGYPTNADLQAAYERAKPQLAVPGQYHVSQIFLPAPLGDADAVAAARKQAQDLVRRAQAPKADFAALAQANSRDETTRAQGGDIGFVPLAQLTPEMRPVVQQMKAGDVSAPVQSAAGFHILKLTALQPAGVTPFDQVSQQLRAALRSQRQELAARAYMEGLLNAGTVSIDGAALNAALEQSTAATPGPASVARAP